MSCGCGCTGFSYAVPNIVPCRCNQFNQIPPTICSPADICATSSSYIRDAQLCCMARSISQSYFALYDGLAGKADQQIVLETQKALLITAMKDYKCSTCDIEKIFTRDETVNGILSAIKASIDLLSADLQYSTYVSLYKTFTENVNTYFDFAASS